MVGVFDNMARVLIKESVIQFINKHSNTDRNNLDEIVLDYIVGVFEKISQEEFDVEEFTEILSGYFNDFDNIPKDIVNKWANTLINKLQQQQHITTFTIEAPPAASGTSDNLELLLEMFPCLSMKEGCEVLSLTKGDMERAVQMVLLQDDLVLKVKSDDDGKVLKDRVVQRYGFIDKAQDNKEFKPILPKEEPKKLVRYREGQVVSTKGERYSEVCVNKEGEEVKYKSYISKSQR